MKTTARVVAEREPWLREGLAQTLTKHRTHMFLALCGMYPDGMAANQVELLLTLAEEGIARERNAAN